MENLDTFKIIIKKWKPENCLCMLCKVYIDRVRPFFLKKKPELFLKMRSFCTNTLQALSGNTMHICN